MEKIKKEKKCEKYFYFFYWFEKKMSKVTFWPFGYGGGEGRGAPNVGVVDFTRISSWYAFSTDPHFELIRIPYWSGFWADTHSPLISISNWYAFLTDPHFELIRNVCQITDDPQCLSIRIVPLKIGLENDPQCLSDPQCGWKEMIRKVWGGNRIWRETRWSVLLRTRIHLECWEFSEYRHELGRAGSPNQTKNKCFLQIFAARDGNKMNAWAFSNSKIELSHEKKLIKINRNFVWIV